MPSDDNDSIGEIVRPTEGSPRRKSKKSNKTTTTSSTIKKDVTQHEPPEDNPIIRDRNSGTAMNQRNILAGYGVRGERIRHTVQDGALQMPREAWHLIKETTQETGIQQAAASVKYSLPLIDSVMRPSLDPKITRLHVTRLEMEKVEVVQEPPQVDPAMLLYLQQSGQPLPQAKVIKVLQPKAGNKVIHRVPKKNEAASVVSEAERIRGGGGEGSETPDDTAGGDGQQPSQPPPAEPGAALVPSVIGAQPEAPKPSSSESINQNPGDEGTIPAMALPEPDAPSTQSTVPNAPPSDATVAMTNTSNDATTQDGLASQMQTEVAPAAEDTVKEPKPSNDPAPMDVEFQKNTTHGTASEPSDNTAPTTDATPISTTAAPSSTVANDQAAPDAAPNEMDPSGAPGPAPEISQDETKESLEPTKQDMPAPSLVQPSATGATQANAAIPPVTGSASEPAAVAAAGSSAPSEEYETKASADKVPSAMARPKGGKDFVKMEESNAQAARKEEKETPPAQSLDSKPPPEWEQHKPGPNDETVTPLDQLPERPEWYRKDSISDIERSMLPEWFDSSSPHRTPESYMRAREIAVKMTNTMVNRNVTSAMMRRSIVGDAGSLLRLRDFLVHWGIINDDAINDSAPTPASLRTDLKRPKEFSEDMRSDLILAVVHQAKRQKLGTDADGDYAMGVDTISSFTPISWEEVASKVGHGASAEECQQKFMMESLQPETSVSSAERPITPEATNDASKLAAVVSKSSSVATTNQTKEDYQREFIASLVQKSSPYIIEAVFNAAVNASGGIVPASQAAALLGLQLSRSVEEARSHEVDLAERLSKLVDMRMKKLENRMAMMDDVEGMLEAEKTALELERRDLYTARCKHWFGGA
jgi:SWI/SNF related-matrix-associated actin-dependent regulator of chromatin subfamily C